MSSLAQNVLHLQNPVMQVDRVAVAAELPLHPQEEVECRRCAVHCDKIVYPGACVERACPFLYAYEDHGQTFVGCMQRVFDVDIDLDLLREAEAETGGFGGIRAVRGPLPICPADVDPCYEARADELGCVNPEFHELPQEHSSFRVFAQVGGGA